MSISTQVIDKRRHFNLPNALTWLRILMIPAIIVLFYLPYWWADPAACAGFAIAGITDTLDGYYARKLGLTSRLGAFLDPVADKLIVASALVRTVSLGSSGRPEARPHRHPLISVSRFGQGALGRCLARRLSLHS